MINSCFSSILLDLFPFFFLGLFYFDVDGLLLPALCRNFMIQGGDPTSTGRGGESIWGKPFKDELDSRLLHSGRGVVSMANSGPHTNGSQFFILYKSANHLNFKHTVFGGVVGGLTTLSTMEKVPVDDNDRPLVSYNINFLHLELLI